jgi:cysteine desulfurase
VEHPSIDAAANVLARRGWHVTRLPVDEDGIVARPAELLPLVEPNFRLMTTMLGNNETGVIQPITALAPFAESCRGVFHTDAVQAVGKIDVHFRALGVHSLSFTAHKFHGPLGIGGLLIRGDTEIAPQLFGGFQQAGLRPGTESAPLVIGLRTALELWKSEQAARRERLERLRDRLEHQICSALADAKVVATGAERLPHTSNISFVGLDRQELFVALDMAGVACSTGSACASGSSEPSPVLVAMGAPEAVIRGSLRFSLGAETTTSDIDEASRRILLICNKLERQKGG